MNALERLEILEAEETLKAKEKFKVKDLNSANWALRKIAVYNKKLANVKELADEERYRIQCWEEREKESINRSIEFFENLLAEYLAEQRKEDPKFKISTPYGSVSTRRQQDKWEYQDKTVLEYLKSINAKKLIRVKEELNKEDLRKAVEIQGGKAIYQGVALPGITILKRPEKVVVNCE